jgi:GNAT superfamily N-acetyltransferase
VPIVRRCNPAVSMSAAQDETSAASSSSGGCMVRQAAEHELPRALEVVNEAMAGAYALVRAPDAPPRTTVERMRHQMPEGDTECVVLVCVDSESSAICGTIMTTLHHHDFATAGRPDTDSFGSLGVAVSAQGRGVGRLLVEAAESRARRRGKRRMELCFAHGSKFPGGQPQLLQFYERLGYARGEREELDRDWYNVLPEFREGMYFQQMVKQL